MIHPLVVFFVKHHPSHGKKQRVKLKASYDLESVTLTVNTFTDKYWRKPLTYPQFTIYTIVVMMVTMG